MDQICLLVNHKGVLVFEEVLQNNLEYNQVPVSTVKTVERAQSQVETFGPPRYRCDRKDLVLQSGHVLSIDRLILLSPVYFCLAKDLLNRALG
jgi:hypothetical protein